VAEASDKQAMAWLNNVNNRFQYVMAWCGQIHTYLTGQHHYRTESAAVH